MDPSLHLAHLKTALRTEQLNILRPALDAQSTSSLSQSLCRGSCSDAWSIRIARSFPGMYIDMGTHIYIQLKAHGLRHISHSILAP